ncbi:MAG: hypothetical protein AB8G22_14305, partial [Saprospiraceae bacterium]
AFIAMAQTPQAICYQGGATNDTGEALANQTIGIRASIVSENPNGVVIWSETHSAETDEFGLFDINIGEGTRTGGQLGQFSELDWGNGKYFLQIEMDATGGEQYEQMGTTQILSVPYALYAEGANRADSTQYATFADSARSADVAARAYSLFGDNDISNTNELQTLTQVGDSLSLSEGNTIVLDVNDADADSTNELQLLTYEEGVLSISGGNSVRTSDMLFGAPGASSDFPLGIIGEHKILMDQPYRVPAGKTFFITAGPSTIILNDLGNAAGIHEHSTTPNMPAIPENVLIDDCYCTGILYDNNERVTAVTIDFYDTSSYDVPEGKILFIKSGLSNELPGYLIVNNVQMEFFRPNFTRGTRIISFPEYTVIRKPDSVQEMVLTGYLIDKVLEE